jgi:hypothetical protein
VDQRKIEMDEAKQELKIHYAKICGPESMKTFEKIFLALGLADFHWYHLTTNFAIDSMR